VKTRDLQPPVEPQPMDPLFEIGDLVERARAHLMEAARIADANQMPAVHLAVTEARGCVMECQAELATWGAER
jgi:hypothetical protein